MSKIITLVLFLILEKLATLGLSIVIICLMVIDLPTGRMKSREGSVVDADDFIQEMVDTAQDIAETLGKLDGIAEEDANELYETIGLGALKYFMLKVDPKKRMLFNPEESVDFNGNTGPFIQYAYARIQSLNRKYTKKIIMPKSIVLTNKEKLIIKQLIIFPNIIEESANSYSPALVANYVYDLVKSFNNYYQTTPIITADTNEIVNFRLALSLKIGEVIKTSMGLLGVNVPDRM